MVYNADQALYLSKLVSHAGGSWSAAALAVTAAGKYRQEDEAIGA